MERSEYIVTSNAGPNDRTIGKRVSTKDQALGVAKTMLKSMSATIIEIRVVPKGQEVVDCLPVKTEAEAGVTV